MFRIALITPVVAALALGAAGVGAAIVATTPDAAPATVINNTAPLPSPVTPHPLHHMNPIVDAVVPGPVAIDPGLLDVANPADTYEADPSDPSEELSIQFSSSNTSVTCNTQAPVQSYQHISFSWNVTGAEHVYFGVDTTDAQTAPMFVDLPHSGTSHAQFPSGYEDYTYACPEPSHLYTLTAVDAQGHKISRTVTIVNNGDTSY